LLRVPVRAMERKLDAASTPPLTKKLQRSGKSKTAEAAGDAV
jgi:hypothetical protein